MEHRTNIPQEPAESPLSTFLWGGQERFQRRKTSLEVLLKHPLFSKFDNVPYALARKDVWTRAALQSKELMALKFRLKWSNEQFMDAVALTDWMVPVYTQFRIFMSNLERQMSDDQKKIWIPLAETFQILGCYCQTELGHGSNVKGIETTATFDGEKDEFVLSSPTLSSTKYWIGAAGIWATHGIVAAKLIIEGEDYGVHMFLTQLRDLTSHRLMRGVEIYELGPKAFQGMMGNDNGAVRFHGVRIARDMMLARSAQVLRDGSYVKPRNLKHAYGSMVTVRALMAEVTGWELIKAVTIAYHYTTFRRQFPKQQSPQQDHEVRVFDYASVRYRLTPLLSQATALILVGQRIKRVYQEYTAIMLRTDDTSALEDMHLQTVTAKVYSTEIVSRGVETCRIACGGHGYSALSGFARLYAHTVNAVTYEGDNYVISQQVTKLIWKYYNRTSEIGVPPSFSFLRLQPACEIPIPEIGSHSDWYRLDVQTWAFESRLANLTKIFVDDQREGRDTSYLSHSLAMAYGDFIYFQGVWRIVTEIENADEPFVDSVRALALVFSLSVLYNPHHTSISHALSLSRPQLAFLRQAYCEVIEQLAINHIGEIIQAYGLTEFELSSALARSDQTPYEALFDGARSSEMSGDRMSHTWPLIVEATQQWKTVHTDTVMSRAKL